jgi:hypothetical protein
MKVTLAELEELIRATDAAKEQFVEICDDGYSYEEVRIMFVNRLGMTFGKATDRIEMMEKLTGRTLAR